MTTEQRIYNMAVRAWNNYLSIPSERAFWAALFFFLTQELEQYNPGYTHE